MQQYTFTNFHCHTNVDPCCDAELTPAYYAGVLSEQMPRVVITDHGFMHYFVHENEMLWSGRWMSDPALYDANRQIGNARVRAAIKCVRDLKNPNVFIGIETDVMLDGRFTHDPEFTDQFDVILCGLHFAPWIEKMKSNRERETAWLDFMALLLEKPQFDVFSHPFRWLALVNKGDVSDDTIVQLLRWVEQRGVTVELNSNANTPEGTEIRLLHIAAERGLPLVVGTDSHKCAQATNFSLAIERLKLAGLTPKDLYVPGVEDFIARKGRRDAAASRPTNRGGGAGGA